VVEAELGKAALDQRHIVTERAQLVGHPSPPVGRHGGVHAGARPATCRAPPYLAQLIGFFLAPL
jgi:hypothetical protein